MPVPEVFDLRMMVLDFPEHPFLVLAVLKETDRRPARLGPGFNDAGNVDGEFSLVFLECPDNAPAGFVLVEPLAFIKDLSKGSFCYRTTDLVSGAELHSHSPLPH